MYTKPSTNIVFILIFLWSICSICLILSMRQVWNVT
jgi:hypothetical protein